MKQYQRALVQIESQILSFLVLAPDELDSDFLWKIPLLLLFLLVLVHSTDRRKGQLEGNEERHVCIPRVCLSRAAWCVPAFHWFCTQAF